MRIIGSWLVIYASFIALHFDVITGLVVHLVALSISVPFFIKSKALDLVIMMAFLIAINAGGLITAAIYIFGSGNKNFRVV